MRSGWWSDLRSGARVIRDAPLFAVVTVVSVAIGIGANATIFSLANGLLLRPRTGIAEPERLVDIGRSRDGRGFDNASYPNYLDLRARNASFEDVAAFRIEPRPYSLDDGSGVDRVYGTTVSGNYFSVLGTRPHLGRFFADEEDHPGAGRRAVVLSHALWTRRFNADPTMVGRVISLNGTRYDVVGVAPPGFQGTAFVAPDLWLTINAVAGRELLRERRAVWLVMVGRLKPDVTLAQAGANADAIADALARDFPDSNAHAGFALAPSARVPGPFATPVKAFLALLTTLVGLVLGVACINVAGMLLARGAARRREIAVRLALGASRGRLVRQLLTEGLLLFALAGALGLALSFWISRGLLALVPALPVPVTVDLSPDWRVMAFTATLTLLVGVLSGLVPALQCASPSLVPALRNEATSALGRLRLHTLLVAGQIATTVLVLGVAGLFLRSLHSALSIDPGFDPRAIDVVSIDLSIGGLTDRTGPALRDRLQARVLALPGVTHAAWSRVLPLTGSGFSLGEVLKDGQVVTRESAGESADWNVVSPEYFEMLRIPLLRGRPFSTIDRAGAPDVAIVNETLARRFWPGEDPVGRTLATTNPRDGRRSFTVVGVARNARYRSLGDEPRLFVYVPLAQHYMPDMDLLIRTSDDRRIAVEVRALLREMAPTLPIVNAMAYSDYINLGLTPQRVAGALSGALGLVGLMLAAIGIYGVSAYSVARRTREIGVRVALGAARRDVVRLVLGQSLKLGLSGALVGSLAAIAVTRALGSLLLGVSPGDPITFGAIFAVFAAVTVGASWVPVRRALAIDPMRALRWE